MVAAAEKTEQGAPPGGHAGPAVDGRVQPRRGPLRPLRPCCLSGRHPLGPWPQERLLEADAGAGSAVGGEIHDY